MSDDYVRKDLYDEGIKRIEAMMAASKAENADIKEKQAEYERRHDRFINYIGIVITLCGAVVAIAQLSTKRRNTPCFSYGDISRNVA